MEVEESGALGRILRTNPGFLIIPILNIYTAFSGSGVSRAKHSAYAPPNPHSEHSTMNQHVPPELQAQAAPPQYGKHNRSSAGRPQEELGVHLLCKRLNSRCALHFASTPCLAHVKLQAARSNAYLVPYLWVVMAEDLRMQLGTR